MFALDSDGFISTVEAEDRQRQERRVMRERPWRGAFSDYRVVDGRSIPHAAEVGWVVDGAAFSVWQGRLGGWSVVNRQSDGVGQRLFGCSTLSSWRFVVGGKRWGSASSSGWSVVAASRTTAESPVCPPANVSIGRMSRSSSAIRAWRAAMTSAGLDWPVQPAPEMSRQRPGRVPRLGVPARRKCGATWAPC